MQNPVLERQRTECKELAQVWRRFLDLFNAAIRGGEALTPENEQRFLECKSRIAMLHDIFMDSLKHDQQIGQNVFLIIARCITMRHVNRMSQAETKKIEIEWHEAYLLMNETATSLDEEIQRLAAINPTKYYLNRFFGRVRNNIRLFLTSKVFKVLVAAAVLFFVLYGIPAFGIYDYDNLRRVSGVKNVYFQWMNIKRTVYSPTTPYGQLSDFESRYLPSNPPPSGFSYEANDADKSKAAGFFSGVVLEGGRNMKNDLQGVEEYKALRVAKIGSPSSKVEIYLFYFHDNRDAQEIALNYNKLAAAYPNTPLFVFAMNNVLVVLNSPDKTLRNLLAADAFKQKVF